MSQSHAMKSVAVATRKLPLQRNGVISSKSMTSFAASGNHDELLIPRTFPTSLSTQRSPLARLPTSMLLRSLFLSTVLTSPILFKPGLAVLRVIANSNMKLLNPDESPLLRSILKAVVYDQFCAGTSENEVRETLRGIKRQGYSGVILSYSKELHPNQYATSRTFCEDSNKAEIHQWKEENLRTLSMMDEGDWLGIKVTGAGRGVTDALIRGSSLPNDFMDAMHQICRLTAAKRCRLWIDAEQHAAQAGIDSLALDLMRVYNKRHRPVVYNTIQAYLKDSRPRLQSQLRLAVDEGWTMAIKLVRGAYMGSEARNLIHDTKADTDACYDGIVHDLLVGSLPGWPISRRDQPLVELFLAGHNPQSIRKAFDLAQRLSASGSLKTVPEFGQLQGMADDIGCELLQRAEDHSDNQQNGGWKPRVYKYLTWGSVRECMLYLVRRAIENQGATDRMLKAPLVLRELNRRFWSET